MREGEPMGRPEEKTYIEYTKEELAQKFEELFGQFEDERVREEYEQMSEEQKERIAKMVTDLIESGRLDNVGFHSTKWKGSKGSYEKLNLKGKLSGMGLDFGQLLKTRYMHQEAGKFVCDYENYKIKLSGDPSMDTAGRRWNSSFSFDILPPLDGGEKVTKIPKVYPSLKEHPEDLVHLVRGLSSGLGHPEYADVNFEPVTDDTNFKWEMYDATEKRRYRANEETGHYEPINR